MVRLPRAPCVRIFHPTGLSLSCFYCPVLGAPRPAARTAFLGIIVPLIYITVCVYYLHGKSASINAGAALDAKTTVTHLNMDTSTITHLY